MDNLDFRFYRTKKKEMVYGFEGCSTTYVLSMWENERHVSKPMQYTGLKDENGTKIYTGDICKTLLGIVGEVVLNKGSYSLKNRDGIYAIGSLPLVIGNVYENVDLL